MDNEEERQKAGNPNAMMIMLKAGQKNITDNTIALIEQQYVGFCSSIIQLTN